MQFDVQLAEVYLVCFVGEIVSRYGKTSDAFMICEFRYVFTIVKM